MQNRIYLTAVLLGIMATPALQAGYGSGDARREKLYATFIAPCCWRENLTMHDSPAADLLRTRIDNLMAEGRSDNEIKGALVGEFGLRILSLPEGQPRLWLFWTPFAVGALGLSALVIALKRLKSRPGALKLAPAELPENWESEA